MLGLISDPAHERFYRSENDRMPSFAKNLEKPATHTVSVRELSLIVDWIRGEFYQASDKVPILPHEPEYARKAVELARALPPELAAAGGGLGGVETAEHRARRLFRLNCAACHSYVDEFGQGIAASNPSAPNLHRFASREWLAGLLDPKRIGGPAYFGNTSHAEGEMPGFVNDSFGSDEPSEEVLQQRQQIIVALSAEAKLPAQIEADAAAERDGTLEAGRTAIAEAAFDGGSCIDCHKYGDNGDLGSYPDLTGYGSLEWLKAMIADPENERHYAEGNDRMPAFAQRILADEEIELLARWLRGEKLE
jgi:ubiquinol-cytochrome c reductase cytochrome b subunit